MLQKIGHVYVNAKLNVSLNMNGISLDINSSVTLRRPFRSLFTTNVYFVGFSLEVILQEAVKCVQKICYSAYSSTADYTVKVYLVLIDKTEHRFRLLEIDPGAYEPLMTESVG